MNQSKQYWMEHIAAAGHSGLSLSRYASRHNVPVKALYYWRSKLTKQDARSLRGASVSVPASVPARRFVAVRVAESAPLNQLSSATSRCQLVLASGIRLEMSELPDPVWLIALQRAASGIR